MLRGVIRRGSVVPAVAALALALSILPASTAAASPRQHGGCWDQQVTPTVEEQRLIADERDPSMGKRILDASGLSWLTNSYRVALCVSPSPRWAERVTEWHARTLWRLAVNQAQHSSRRSGPLPGNDDRPLYWARLSMTHTLRAYDPLWFHLSDGRRAALQRTLEFGSRGMLDTRFSPRHGRTTMFVSGFDPFLLDSEPRRSNPSGSAAMALDGRVFRVGRTVVEVEAVVFPVRFPDFDQGMVEDVYRPVFAGRPWQRADLYATISQGRPGAFDLEVNNGRRRSSTADGNLGRWGGGTRDEPIVFPGVGRGPEFNQTTLPVEAMTEAAGQPYPVRVNTSVTEIPAGSTEPVRRENGPTPGSIAVSGGGGGYLSNEIAYRACRLRDALRPDVPGGHIHTPTLPYPDDPEHMTGPQLEQARTDIAGQVRLLVEQAVRAVHDRH